MNSLKRIMVSEFLNHYFCFSVVGDTQRMSLLARDLMEVLATEWQPHLKRKRYDVHYSKLI